VPEEIELVNTTASLLCHRANNGNEFDDGCPNSNAASGLYEIVVLL
jgi:hypothetical protein